MSAYFECSRCEITKQNNTIYVVVKAEIMVKIHSVDLSSSAAAATYLAQIFHDTSELLKTVALIFN